MAKTWKGLKSHSDRGLLAREINSWIRKGFEKDKGFVFNVKDLMNDIGLNFDDRHDYTKVMGYFMKQRKLLKKAMMLFWNGDEYPEYKKNHDDDKIFEALINSAITWDVYPMFADPANENKYGLFDFESYLGLMTRRANSISSEIKNKSEILKTASQGLPSIEERYKKPKALEAGTLLELEESTEEE